MASDTEIPLTWRVRAIDSFLVAAKTLRLDIQGLRAVAVLLVLLYHANLPFLTGGFIGVDVFFVISGFLITSHITQSLANGSFKFSTFYARRVRRILPASFAVLIVSLIVAWFVLPPLDLARVSKDALWTALYVPNLLFAFEEQDYLSSAAPSIFQHYWSLGIEEQFYLLWPMLLWAVYTLSRKNIRAVLWTAGAVVVASFIASVSVTEVNQPWAFFLLPTRAWELGIGGLISFLPLHRRESIPLLTRNLVAGGALLVLAWAALSLDSNTPYPSYWAAVPVLATAAIIAVGPFTGSIARILQNRVMAWIGLISYSLYLVHWPMLIIPEAATSWMRPLELWQSLLIAALAVPVAWLSYRFVETPLRRARTAGRRATWIPLSAAILSAALVTGASFVGMRTVSTLDLTVDREAPQMVLTTDPVSAPFVGSNLSVRLQDARSETAIPSGPGCDLGLSSRHAPPSCTYGSNPNAATVALVGDSHAAQSAPAFERVADEGLIRLTAHTRSGCALHDRSHAGLVTERPECLKWKGQVEEILNDDPPDYIVIGSSSASSQQTLAEYESAMRKMISRLPERSQLVLLQDTPRFKGDPLSCLSNHLDRAAACTVPVSTGLRADFRAATAHLADEYGAKILDLTPYICNAKDCPTVQGNTLVYKDTQHISKTFSAALAPALSEQITSWVTADRNTRPSAREP